MAETCTVAFGRYLKMLRERRGFSLDDVASMSRSLADPVSKGYLSRCENGRHGAGFSKIVTLARVYGVPFEVLAERIELDTELDRLGGPDTDGMSYREMQKKAAAALNRGAFWEAYGLLRDSLPMAASAPVSPSFRDSDEQRAVGCMNLSTAAGCLGRSHLALHELEAVQAAGHISEKHAPAMLDLLSWRYRALGKMTQAIGLADKALAQAEQSGSSEYLGFCLANRARLAYAQHDFRQAIELYQRSTKAYEFAGVAEERARNLLNLGNVYLSQEQFSSARRAALAAERVATTLGLTRVRALVRILLGEVDSAERRPERAVAHWHEAVEIARNLRDKMLLFKALLALFRHSRESNARGDTATLKRRLIRLSAWIPEEVEDLREFRALIQPPR